MPIAYRDLNTGGPSLADLVSMRSPDTNNRIMGPFPQDFDEPMRNPYFDLNNQRGYRSDLDIAPIWREPLNQDLYNYQRDSQQASVNGDGVYHGGGIGSDYARNEYTQGQAPVTHEFTEQWVPFRPDPSGVGGTYTDPIYNPTDLGVVDSFNDRWGSTPNSTVNQSFQDLNSRFDTSWTSVPTDLPRGDFDSPITDDFLGGDMVQQGGAMTSTRFTPILPIESWNPPNAGRYTSTENTQVPEWMRIAGGSSTPAPIFSGGGVQNLAPVSNWVNPVNWGISGI